LAEDVLKTFENTPGVVDVDWYVEDKQPKYTLSVDKEKAALSGISTGEVASALKVALGGKRWDWRICHGNVRMYPSSSSFHGRNDRVSLICRKFLSRRQGEKWRPLRNW